MKRLCLQVASFDCSGVISGGNGSGTFSTVFNNGYASRVNVGSNNYYLNQLGNVQGTQATAETLADGTVTAALQAGREETVWVQDPVTNLPMLKVFVKPSNIRGDFNGDGKVGMPDLMFLLQKVHNGKFPDEK